MRRSFGRVDAVVDRDRRAVGELVLAGRSRSASPAATPLSDLDLVYPSRRPVLTKTCLATSCGPARRRAALPGAAAAWPAAALLRRAAAARRRRAGRCFDDLSRRSCRRGSSPPPSAAARSRSAPRGSSTRTRANWPGRSSPSAFSTSARTEDQARLRVDLRIDAGDRCP